MKNIAWNRIRQGDLVQFRYKGSRPNAKARIRTVLILNPRHLKDVKSGGTVRLIHGMELKAVPAKSGALTTRERSDMVTAAAEQRGLEWRELDTAVERIAIVEGTPRSQYSQIKNLVSRYGNYRTYRYDKAKRYPVRLDTDYPWPKQLIEELRRKFKTPGGRTYSVDK